MGWARVLGIVDLAALMPEEAGRDASALNAAWATDWSEPGADAQADERIDDSIDAVRQTRLAVLRNLR